MALSRRTGARFQASIWPGFVDAMTGLLLVLMFVLTIFMVMQFVLQETIKGQGMQLDELNLDIVQKNDQLQDLAGQISALGNALGLERATAANLRDQVAGLDSSLAAAKADGRSQLALISTLTGQRDARIAELNSANSRINDFETKVASLLVLQQQAEGDIDAFKLQVSQLQNAKAEAEVEISDFENQVVSLLQQQDTLDGQITEFEAQLTLLVAQAMEDTTSIATVESQVTELEAQNATASATIGDFEARVRQMLAEQARDRANIAELGSERASLQQSLLAAQATITAQVERAALAEKQRALMDEMLDDMRRDTQATGANLSNTLALLASQQQRAVALEQANQALQERAKGLDESLEEGQLKINELLEEGQLEIAAAAILRERLFDAETALTQQELERFSMAAATEKLRKDLENSEAALSSLALQLNDQRKKAERTLTLLAAAQTAGSGLNEKLVTALLTLEAAKAAETLSQEQLAALQKQDAATTQELQEALLRLKNREIKLAQLQTDLEMAQGSLRAKAAELQSTQSRLEEVLPLREALARAISEQTTLEEKLTDAETEAALLATAQGELSKAEAISTEAQRQMALLSAEVGELRAQIGGLQSILDDARRRDEDNNVKITNLGSDLNMALAQAASEARKNLVLETVEKQRLAEEAARLAIEAKSLGQYKSEFFGRMRGLLEGIEGVQIVGDRFVFSSEVLFPSGGADLSDGGQRDIAKVSKILQNIADQMPSGIDWILQVDGHTDDQAVLPGSEWGSNWELSQARALSIVLFLANEQGMEPSRLSANGFGEFQPLNPEDTPAARAQNRRIELKLTER
ncbi:MAG: peptidoglycan -binding protein [Planktomarina sp.]|nr:peptidoglycan -binding protein [Planktomarina sp.]